MSFHTIWRLEKLTAGMDRFGRKTVPSIFLALTIAAGPSAAGILGVDVDVGVSIGGGGGGANVGAGVSVGGTGVGVDLGVGLGGGAATPGAPGIANPTNPAATTAKGGASGMACAKDGNETAYNGFIVRDRDGAMIGWVHEATVSKGGKLLAMRIKSTGNGCYKLSNAGFRISGGEVWANVEGASFR